MPNWAVDSLLKQLEQPKIEFAGYQQIQLHDVKVAELLTQLIPEVTASLTGYDLILKALSVANFF